MLSRIVQVREAIYNWNSRFYFDRAGSSTRHINNGAVVNDTMLLFYSLLLHCRPTLSLKNVFGEDISTFTSNFCSDKCVENTIVSQTTSAPCVCVCVPCTLLVGQRFRQLFSSNIAQTLNFCQLLLRSPETTFISTPNTLYFMDIC